MPYFVEEIDFGSHLSLGLLEVETRLYRQELWHGYSCHCVEIGMTLDENDWVVSQTREDLGVRQAVSFAVVSRQRATLKTRCNKISHLIQHHQSCQS